MWPSGMLDSSFLQPASFNGESSLEVARLIVLLNAG